MKKISIILISLLISVISYSQKEGCDNIIQKNGEELSAKVSEITPSVVKYKRCDNLEGPTFSMEKEKILMIRYMNGTKEVFNTPDTRTNPDYVPNSTPDKSTSNSASKNASKPSFGFRLGLQSVAVGNSNYSIQSQYGSRLGLLFGVTSFIPVGKKIDIRPGLIYTSKGASYTDYTNVYLGLNYIEIPVDVAYRIGSGGFALSVGPYLAFLTNAKDYDLSGNEIDLNSYYGSQVYNGTDFGLNFGASYLIAGKFNLDVRYGMGLTDVTTYYYDLGNTQVNAALQFSIGMQF